jgi:hypothetical protein
VQNAWLVNTGPEFNSPDLQKIVIISFIAIEILALMKEKKGESGERERERERERENI